MRPLDLRSPLDSLLVPALSGWGYIQIAKSSCGNEIVGGGRELVPLRGNENSDSGVEAPVPALFLGRGCSSTPSSRLGPGVSTRGPSTGPSAGSGLSAQDLQHFRNLFWQPV